MGRGIRIGIAFVLVLALAVSAGCAQIAEKAARGAVEKATGVKVDEKKGSVTVTGKDGKSVSYSGSEDKLPDNLPADFPVYDGTPDGGSASATTDEGSTWTFNIATTDKVAQVSDWYKDELTNKGWTIETSSTATINTVESAGISAKKDKLEAMVSISGDTAKGDKVSVGVILSEKTK